MGKVVMDMSMSLDGLIAGPNDDVARLHDWIFEGKTAPGTDVLDELVQNTGAFVMGRRTFELHPSGPYGLPAFILTHHPKRLEGLATGRSAVTFVTDGIESALKQAEAVAGDKNIGLMGANIQQQYLRAGLVDEVRIHLIPVLLGGGTRLFDHLGTKPIKLQQLEVIDSPAVTHLSFRGINEGKEIS
jgi:dihydrofolate reductase